MSPVPPRHRWGWLAGLGLAGLLVVAGCTDGGDDGPSELGDEVDDSEEATTTPEDGNNGDVGDPGEPDPTPIELSADVTVGSLDNGLRYFIQANDSPGGQSELLLVVDAGSAQQRVADSGGAHFLEHMMFNGTEEYPANELDAVLRGLGVEIGPDLNAFTSFDETVYQLGMPSAAEDDLRLGLEILGQWAGSATIDQGEVEAERGVVREELRVRSETGSAAVNERLFEIYASNSGYEGHLPIGSEERILATNADELRQFYDDWYRPDNMAVVAVGDFDPADVERLIKEELSGLTDRGSTPDRGDVETGSLTEPIVEVVARQGGPEPSISLDYHLPNWDPSTVGGQRRLLADSMVATMLNAYLDELAAQGNLDIVRPGVSTFDFTRSRRFLGMNVAAEDYLQGSTDLMRAMRTVQETGFTERHRQVALEQMEAFVEQTVASHDTRQDSDVADQIVAHVLAGQPLESIEGWQTRVSDQIASLTLDELNQLFKWELAQTAPLFTLLGSDPDALPSQSELEVAVAAGMEGELIEQAEAVDIEQLLARPSGPDPIEDDSFLGFDDQRIWRFDNGATVLYWNSTIAANQVDVWVLTGSGRSGLSERDGVLSSLATTAATNSGVAGVNQVTLDRYLASRSVGLAPFIDTRFQGMSGSSSPEDLPALFELIHGYFTEPQVDRPGLAEARNRAKALLRSLDTEPGFASAVAERQERFNGERQLVGIPTNEEVDSADADELQSIFDDRFRGAADLLLVVVGDVDAERVLDVTSDYIGTLPEGEPDPVVEREPYPTGPIQLEVEAGLNDSGAGFDRYYASAGVFSPDESVVAELVATIINGRLFDRVREELGASYGGGNASFGTGYLNSNDTTFTISVNGDPARLDEIRAAVDEELDQLVAEGPSVNDLTEAKAILSNDAQLVNNFDLMNAMLEFHTFDWDEAPFGEEEVIADTTAAEVQAMAARLMADENLIEVTRLPAGR